jgi:TrmH family RNA methyltransferase
VRATETPVTQLDDRLFSDVSDLKTPSGVIALIDLPSPEVRVRDTNFILLLEDIQDPGNLGSMLRTAAAAGCDAVFLSENCVDAWSPKVLRAAMGGHFVLQIFERQSLIDVVAEFRGELYATSLRSERSLYDCRFQGNLGFLVGNEGAGLSNALLDRVSQVIKIPMCGALESLNVAAATAICLFEATRQRHQQN